MVIFNAKLHFLCNNQVLFLKPEIRQKCPLVLLFSVELKKEILVHVSNYYLK